MTPDVLDSLAALLLATSLAAERLVEIVKQLFPGLASEKTEGVARMFPRSWSYYRPIIVFAMALGASWITAALLANGGFDLFGEISVGSDPALELPVLLVGALGAGGSAFWRNIVGYTGELKKARKLARINAAPGGDPPEG